MATLYVVTGRSATFGPGMVLRLTRAQIIVRAQSLAPVGESLGHPDEYIVTVIEPIEFKAGERVAVVEGAVSKSALTALTSEGDASETDAPEKDQETRTDGSSDPEPTGSDGEDPRPKGSGRG